ncbi:MAG TPA: DUF4388 domain-containing protein [Vicinamibacteria bacterium]|nr:DUF4388 domain-containing protein [Vicinamibacteria bacterium]
MHKILEGDLGRLDVPDVLTFLNMGRRTGVLALEKIDQETKLFFREGNPVYASSSKEDLHLGAMLVRMRKVSADLLDRAVNKPRSGRWRVGSALLAEKVVSETELASFLKVQVSEVIFDTFTWREGLFTFWEKVPPPATAVTLEMDLQNLLMEGSRRLDERSRLSEVFPDLNMAVESVTNPERVKHSVTMTPDEWKVYFLVDGRRSLSEICRLIGQPDELATLQILHHLVKAKFVAVVNPPEDDTPVPPVEGAGHSTSKFQDGKASTPVSSGVSVQFQDPARAPKVEADDTKEIVSPKAVQYMANRKQVVSSRLVLVTGDAETSFPLTRDAYTIGRHRNNDIVISDPKVSSFHARIDRSAEGYLLVDLKSRNGSYVNGKRIETGLLKTGDEVRMGTARLAYKVDYTSPLSPVS